jgi:hypothetical protein
MLRDSNVVLPPIQLAPSPSYDYLSNLFYALRVVSLRAAISESESLCKMSLLPLMLSLIGDLELLHVTGPGG